MDYSSKNIDGNSTPIKVKDILKLLAEEKININDTITINRKEKINQSEVFNDFNFLQTGKGIIVLSNKTD